MTTTSATLMRVAVLVFSGERRHWCCSARWRSAPGSAPSTARRPRAADDRSRRRRSRSRHTGSRCRPSSAPSCCWAATDKGFPGSDWIVERAEDVAGAVDVDDPARLLAQHEQVSRTRAVRSAWTDSRARRRRRNRAVPTSAGSNRFVEFDAVGEPLVAVPAAKSISVWKMPCGSISLTAMKPLVSGSYDMPSMPMFGTKVPSLTVCASARVSVAPGNVGEQHGLAIALLDHHELAAADVGEPFRIVELGALRAAARGQRHRVDQLRRSSSPGRPTCRRRRRRTACRCPSCR